MNYAKHYQALMERAECRVLEGYFERHHVVPKCLDNSSKHTVRLTPEEHFVAHQLLVKMHPENAALVYAAVRMTQGTHNGQSTNKMYGWLRREWLKVITRPWSAVRRAAQTPEVNEKIAAGHRGREPWNKGQPASLEARARMRHPRSLEGREAMKGIAKSEVHKEKLRLASLAYAAVHPGRKHTPETIEKLLRIQGSPEMRARNSERGKGRIFSPEAISNMIAAQNRPEVKAQNKIAQLARSAENSAAQIAAWEKKKADPKVYAALCADRVRAAKESWARRKALQKETVHAG